MAVQFDFFLFFLNYFYIKQGAVIGFGLDTYCEGVYLGLQTVSIYCQTRTKYVETVDIRLNGYCIGKRLCFLKGIDIMTVT